MHIIDKLLSLPEPILHYWGYLIIMLAATFEATPLLGAIVPGQIMVMIGGLLAQQGVLNVVIVFLLATFGAITGDSIGYFLGKKYGYQSLAKYGKHFYFKPEHLEKVRDLVKKNSGKTLIIGRFSPITRALAPFAAGMSDVKAGKFLLYNIAGSLIWASSAIMIGFVFGASYEIMSKIIGRFIFIGVFIAILAIFGYRFINKKEHAFEKYHLHTFGICLSFLIIFFRMADAIADNDWIIKLDLIVRDYIINFWSNHLALTKLMLIIGDITKPTILVALSIIFLLFLLIKKKWYHFILGAFSIGGGYAIELLIKNLTERARPLPQLIEVTGFSFPSGHATMATIISLLIIYSFRDQLKSKIIRWLLALLCIIAMLVVASSRIYLGLHWLSDVIAGISLGVVWVTLMILLIRLVIYSFESGFVEKIKKMILKSAQRF